MGKKYLLLIGSNYYYRLMPVPYAYVPPLIDSALLKTPIKPVISAAKKKQKTTDELYLLFK